MIYSMTGFGDAATEKDDFRYLVEIKSLNNRYFKPTIRLPEMVSGLEPEIESILRRKLGRGSVIFGLRMKGDEPENDTMPQIDVEMLRRYIGQLTQAGLEVREPERLLGLPGVVSIPEPDDGAEAKLDVDIHRDTVLKLTEQAVEALQAMRKREGAMLLADLMLHTGVITQHLDFIRQRSAGVVNQYHDKLLSRVNELLAKAQLNIAKEDLLKEVAVYAERSDISEEVVRLQHHVAQFEGDCRDDEQPHVGRKLDFIAQEMLREANTIGSKANDAEIAVRIVEIKGAIDRIKEQVQNVE